LFRLFDDNPGAEYAIILEDDMIFSRDLLNYFAQVAELYDLDSSIYCISSYNDNGFEGRVMNMSVLHRTDFFIGLGWLVSRKILFQDWLPQWPDDHWDHFVRSDAVRLGRQCVYPEVSRNFNIGKAGIHIFDEVYDKYFAHIKLGWENHVQVDVQRAVNTSYAEWISSLIRDSIVVTDPDLLKSSKNQTLVFYYKTSVPKQQDSKWVAIQDLEWKNIIAPYFGIWHEDSRGAYDAIHFLRHESNFLIFIPNTSPYFKKYHPQAKKFIPSSILDINIGNFEVKIAKPQEDCQETCRRYHGSCSPAALRFLNDCDVLYQHFNCSGCELGSNPDLPSMNMVNGVCGVYSGLAHSCGAWTGTSQRICSCQV
jgi:hypothetical protein